MCNAIVYASLVLGCIATASLTAAAPPAVTEKRLMDLKENTLCPIRVEYNEDPRRLPRRIKMLRCAHPPGTAPAHPLCGAEPKACCGKQFDNYATQCVDVKDEAYVLYEGSDQPEPMTVYVGCSCMIRETTAARDGDAQPPESFREKRHHHRRHNPS